MCFNYASLHSIDYWVDHNASRRSNVRVPVLQSPAQGVYLPSAQWSPQVGERSCRWLHPPNQLGACSQGCALCPNCNCLQVSISKLNIIIFMSSMRIPEYKYSTVVPILTRKASLKSELLIALKKFSHWVSVCFLTSSVKASLLCP